jgi:type I restriction enzyme, S subunit
MGAEWTTVRLGEALEPVKRPVAVKGEAAYRRLGVRWYGNGAFLREEKPGAKIATKTLNAVEPGDIVYSKLFAWKGSFAVIPEWCRGAVASNEFPTYVPSRDRLLPEFFALWASRQEVWDMANDASTGTTAASRNRLAPDAFLELEIELPPLEEQLAIVAAANVADQAVRAWEREVEAADSGLKALREELLCTQYGWEELPDNWRACTLGEVAEIRSGITKGRKVRGELVERPFIRAANVQDGFLDLSEITTLGVSHDEQKRFVLAKDDLLLTEGGNAEHVGRGWLWENQIEKATCQNHVFRARVSSASINPRFLAYAVGASPARAYCFSSSKKTTNLASINKTQIESLPLPLPPSSVQLEIVRKLDALRNAWLRALDAVQNALDVRSALVEDLVTGARPMPSSS